MRPAQGHRSGHMETPHQVEGIATARIGKTHLQRESLCALPEAVAWVLQSDVRFSMRLDLVRSLRCPLVPEAAAWVQASFLVGQVLLAKMLHADVSLPVLSTINGRTLRCSRTSAHLDTLGRKALSARRCGRHAALHSRPLAFVVNARWVEQQSVQ